jgi:hypothetical protein
MPLVRAENYLAVSGPRQSGKTSLLKSLVDAVHAEGWGRAVVLSCESADHQFDVTEVDDAERRLVDRWGLALRAQAPDLAWPETAELLALGTGTRIAGALTRYAQSVSVPLVVVLDEVDCLARNPFGSMLRQIRDGFQYRPRGFPHSVVLAGMRNLREHDRAMGGDGRGSPFNIVRELTLSNFSRDEVVRLYAQHTAATGQCFTDESLELVWQQTRGQPLLVNALADLAVTQLVPDPSRAIEPAHIAESIRLFEASNPIHLTSLAARLAEDRVMNVVAPVVVGDAPDVSDDDERFALELGILAKGIDERLHVANPIYARALLKLATSQQRKSLLAWTPTWLDEAGRIDVDRLRENFRAFWTLHRDMMQARIHYPEAVAHFGLMTYLDRVVNGGGRVEREFAVGRGRLDLLLVHGDLRLPIEVKVHRDHASDPVPEGLEQLDRYCAGLGVDRAWLVVFDQGTGATGTRFEDEEVVTAGGRKVLVVRA